MPLLAASSALRRRCRPRLGERRAAEWDHFQFAPEELVDLGDGRVFASGRIVGSGLSSGAGFDSDWAVLWTISAGRVIGEQFFFNRADALEAAGLREWMMSLESESAKESPAQARGLSGAGLVRELRV